MSEPPCVEDRHRRYASRKVYTTLDSPDYSGLSPFISSPELYVSPVFYYSHSIFVCRALARSGSWYNIKSVVYCYRVLHCSGHGDSYRSPCILCSIYSHLMHLHVNNGVLTQEVS